MTHPIPFASLPADVLARELTESRERLERCIGRPVLGFRAPGWDVGRPTLTAIAAAGYRYDASVLPTPALLAGAAVRFVLSGGRKRPHGVGRSLRAAFSRRWPHRIERADGLHEFPVAVSRFLRLPFTHTLWYVAPRPVCLRTYDGLRRSRVPLSYMLHATDLLDLRRDGVDARIESPPGHGVVAGGEDGAPRGTPVRHCRRLRRAPVRRHVGARGGVGVGAGPPTASDAPRPGSRLTP